MAATSCWVVQVEPWWKLIEQPWAGWHSKVDHRLLLQYSFLPSGTSWVQQKLTGGIFSSLLSRVTHVCYPGGKWSVSSKRFLDMAKEIQYLILHFWTVLRHIYKSVMDRCMLCKHGLPILEATLVSVAPLLPWSGFSLACLCFGPLWGRLKCQFLWICTVNVHLL